MGNGRGQGNNGRSNGRGQRVADDAENNLVEENLKKRGLAEALEGILGEEELVLEEEANEEAEKQKEEIEEQDEEEVEENEEEQEAEEDEAELEAEEEEKDLEAVEDEEIVDVEEDEEEVEAEEEEEVMEEEEEAAENATADDHGIITVSEEGDLSSPNGTAVLFGSLAIPGSTNVIATDASFGVAILSVDGNGEASVMSAQAIDGQAATCWVTISEFTNTAFVTDVGVNRVVEVSLEDASVINVTDFDNGNPGLIDLRAAGSFIYALSPGDGTIPPAVTVIDVSAGSGTAAEIQNFDISALTGANAMGMVALA